MSNSTKEDKFQEMEAELQNIADTEAALVMSFVAPDGVVKKTPASYGYASITVQDLYRIEAAINSLLMENKLPKKLYLVIQTPGGSLDVSIKIAKYLQAMFDEIIAFVPYEAASGGTILCLAASSIVMDKVSNLTPIDPQVGYKGERIAATSYQQAIDDFALRFPTQLPDDLPSPYHQMARSFDPIILKQMDKVIWDTVGSSYQIFSKSQAGNKKKSSDMMKRTIWTLVLSDNPHSHVINIKEAQEIGLNIDEDDDKMKMLRTFKKWVSGMLDKAETNHIIETYCPTLATRSGADQEGENNGKKK